MITKPNQLFADISQRNLDFFKNIFWGSISLYLIVAGQERESERAGNDMRHSTPGFAGCREEL